MATPKRELFKAPEVCEMAQLQPYVLRTWEAEFPSLGQGSGTGPRVYRRADVELVLRIKQMVFGEGLTLAGVRRRLEEEEEDDGEPSLAAVAIDDALGGMARSRLQGVRDGLEAILRLLDRAADDRRPPDLELVPPSTSNRVPRVPKVPKVPKVRKKIAKGRAANAR
jgi:DNA-binding transcriptional MerR regulator